jgi:DNA-binding beta-propeller fold protein YncE
MDSKLRRGAVRSLLGLVAGSALVAALATAAFGFGFLIRWGSPGTGDGQFIFPSGLATNAAGRVVYVADSGNHRIQVFDAAGNFLRTFGGEGSGDGQFIAPFGVATDAAGRVVYVVDTFNHRIQKFG